MNVQADRLRRQILGLVGEYFEAEFTGQTFVPGETLIPVSGKVFDAAELRSLVDASLDFWLTTGRFAEQFEREFAAFFGLREAVLVNSGSSANLLAVACLTSPKLGDRRLRPDTSCRRREHVHFTERDTAFFYRAFEKTRSMDEMIPRGHFGDDTAVGFVLSLRRDLTREQFIPA